MPFHRTSSSRASTKGRTAWNPRALMSSTGMCLHMYRARVLTHGCTNACVLALCPPAQVCAPDSKGMLHAVVVTRLPCPPPSHCNLLSTPFAFTRPPRDSDLDSLYDDDIDFSGENVELGCGRMFSCRNRFIKYTYILLRRGFKWILPIT